MTPASTHLITEATEDFWKQAGIIPKYPLAPTLLEQAICLLLPINIVRLNKLSSFKVVSWLADRNYEIQMQEDCPLCGLLFINRCQGIIFINGSHPLDEQSYTLAHELGHYLLEFEYPRKKAGLLFDNKIDDIFSGTRKPTIEDELSGIIKRVSVSPYIHFLEEGNVSAESRSQVWAAENKADAMAFELLAPFQTVCAQLKSESGPYTFSRIKKELLTILAKNFGLPSSVRQQYATTIAYRLFPHGDDLIEHLKQL
jgi:Zn-dependent peptidase ImmA (M78 family)